MIRYKDRNKKSSLRISWLIGGFLIIIFGFILFYINGINSKWKLTKFNAELHVYTMDTSVYSDSDIAPLTLIMDEKEFELQNTRHNVFQLELVPCEYVIKLIRNNGEVLKIDTFRYTGVNHIHYDLQKVEKQDDNLKVKTDIENFHEI